MIHCLDQGQGALPPPHAATPSTTQRASHQVGRTASTHCTLTAGLPCSGRRREPRAARSSACACGIHTCLGASLGLVAKRKDAGLRSRATFPGPRRARSGGTSHCQGGPSAAQKDSARRLEGLAKISRAFETKKHDFTRAVAIRREGFSAHL